MEKFLAITFRLYGIKWFLQSENLPFSTFCHLFGINSYDTQKRLDVPKLPLCYDSRLKKNKKNVSIFQ